MLGGELYVTMNIIIMIFIVIKSFINRKYSNYDAGYCVFLLWTVQSEFGEIMVDQDIVSDHLPNVVYGTMADLARHQQL